MDLRPAIGRTESDKCPLITLVSVYAPSFNESGQISRLTAIYDSSLISYQAYQNLVALAAEAPM